MEKKIVIKSITLSNWRGLNFSIAFNEGATRISAKNGVGKSSLFKAWSWLLTSFPSATENKNFNLFDNTAGNINPDTPKAVVTAVVQVGDYEYTLEKEAIAKFVRKRSSNEWEKAPSDEYVTRIDNIETSAKDFNTWVETNICPVEMLPYCVSGDYFTELLNNDKNKARKVLETIVGEIKEEDMKGDYSVLKDDMKRFSVDQIEERTKNELKPYKKRQEEIPAIIDDKEKNLAEYKTIDFNSILKDIEKTKGDISAIDESILGKGKEIEPIMGERNRILNLINEKVIALNDARNAHYKRERGKTIEPKEKLQEVWLQNAKIQRENSDNLFEYNAKKELLLNKQGELELLEDKRNKLIAEKDEIKERVFVADRCAYCGQELPEDKIEEAKVKFNKRKQEEYENVVSRGKLNKENIETTKKDIEHLENEISKGFESKELIDVAPYEEALANANKEIVSFERTQECARLSAEIESIKVTLPEIPESDTTALTSAKKVLMDSLESLNRRYGLKAKMDDIIAGIENLRKELKEVGVVVARLEGKIDKCKEYKQEKAEIVSYRVNGRMVESHIDMYSQLKDGSIVPDVTLKGKDGVRYASLNMAHQIKTKIELQTLFMEHYEVSLPCWIDESSCFDSTNLPKSTKQMIYLYADDSPYLVVE